MTSLGILVRKFRNKLQDEPLHVRAAAPALVNALDNFHTTRGKAEHPYQKTGALAELDKFEKLRRA